MTGTKQKKPIGGATFCGTLLNGEHVLFIDGKRALISGHLWKQTKDSREKSGTSDHYEIVSTTPGYIFDETTTTRVFAVGNKLRKNYRIRGVLRYADAKKAMNRSSVPAIVNNSSPEVNEFAVPPHDLPLSVSEFAVAATSITHEAPQHLQQTAEASKVHADEDSERCAIGLTDTPTDVKPASSDDENGGERNRLTQSDTMTNSLVGVAQQQAPELFDDPKPSKLGNRHSRDTAKAAQQSPAASDQAVHASQLSTPNDDTAAKYLRELETILAAARLGDDPQIRIGFMVEFLGASPATIYRKLKVGKFPAPVKRGTLSFWKFSEVKNYRDGKSTN